MNLVSNGSFETGDFTGWTKSGNISINNLPVSEGNFSAGFSYRNTANNGMLSQDLQTVIGQSYSLSFDFGVNGDPFIDQNLQVELIGSNVLLDETLTKQGPINFDSFSFSFVADAATTRLKFTDRSNATVRIDVQLDNVSVEDIQSTPEPRTILGLLATLGLGAMLRREKSES